jgi:predicted secreted protein
MMTLLIALTAAAPNVAAPATPAPAKEERVICRREHVTGSLARVRKTCKTASQWDGDQNSAVKETQNMQDRGLINSEAPR